MCKSEVKEFISKILKDIEINKVFEITYKNYKDKIQSEINIFRDEHDNNVAFILGLNKLTFKNNENLNWCLGIILHELGHYCTSKGTASGLNEYKAHCWAWEKASELKMYDVMVELMKCIIGWKKANWKTERIYRIAYNIAVKENFIKEQEFESK